MHASSRIVLSVIAIAVVAGGYLAWRESVTGGGGSEPSASGSIPRLTVYTNPGATTPQIPFWAARSNDGLAGSFAVDMRQWKSTTQLQGLLLSGQGDLWIGHIDGFARARARGAPVVLLAVTGWRKMSLVSRETGVVGVEDFLDGRLAYAPVGSPAVTVLEALLGAEASRIQLDPHEPKQLALQMIRGEVTSALLPEPLVTVLLGKVEGLRVVCNLEDLYAASQGGPARMPLAGIAVHERVAERHSEILGRLLALMKTAAVELQRTPRRAADVLPAEFSAFVPREIVEASLGRDLLLVEAASGVREEVERYLKMVAPDLRDGNGDLPVGDAFYWQGGE